MINDIEVKFGKTRFMVTKEALTKPPAVFANAVEYELKMAERDGATKEECSAARDFFLSEYDKVNA